MYTRAPSAWINAAISAKRFQYPRRVRVGDHDASNAPPVAIGLAQVVHIDLPVGTSIDLDHAREGFAPRCRFKPAMVAVAGFVPWAECGMRTISRCISPRLR
jgi:hypothetical protein